MPSLLQMLLLDIFENHCQSRYMYSDILNTYEMNDTLAQNVRILEYKFFSENIRSRQLK